MLALPQPRAPSALRASLLPSSNKQVRVDFEWHRLMGAPARPPIQDIFSLHLGEWGRVRWNGRSALDETWSYGKWVFNIGFFPSLTTNIFMATEPTFRHSEMAVLW